MEQKIPDRSAQDTDQKRVHQRPGQITGVPESVEDDKRGRPQQHQLGVEQHHGGGTENLQGVEQRDGHGGFRCQALPDENTQHNQIEKQNQPDDKGRTLGDWNISELIDQ